ncbi:MAG TPA: DUF6457 domain-containing protein [Acidimicrobiales bacterium]
MTRDEWITAFAAELGVPVPDATTVDALLDLAGVAAHASERTAAPLTCYLVGLAGVDAGTAAAAAERVRAGTAG